MNDGNTNKENYLNEIAYLLTDSSYIEDKIQLYENYIYDFMDKKISIFQNYNIFTIQKLNEISKEDNNFLKYEFSYEVSQILITYQKDLSYGNKPSLLDNLNIVNNIKNFFSDDYNKKYNLNTNNLKYFLVNSKKNIYKLEIFENSKYKNEIYKILNVGFMDIITNNLTFTWDIYKLTEAAYLGFKYFNNLKKYFPTFGYTYCYMKCTMFDDNFENNNFWCNKTDSKNYLVSYIITDNYFKMFSDIYYKDKQSNIEINNININENNDDINKDIILQLISIFNCINIQIIDKIKNEKDKKLILDFKIINIYYFSNKNNFINIKYFNKDGKIDNINIKYILYIPMIFNYIGINRIEENNILYKVNIKNINNIENINIPTEGSNIKEFIDFFKEYNYTRNLPSQTDNNVIDITYNDNNNLLNKYNYNLSLKKTNKLTDDIFEKKYSKLDNILNYFIKNKNDNENKNIDIELTKFVSEYCLNDLKYMNKDQYKSIKKKELENIFNNLISKKINKLNNEIKNNRNYDDIKIIYNRYVKFIDTLVKAKCLDYKVKLYEIFELKMNLVKKISNSNSNINIENKKESGNERIMKSIINTNIEDNDEENMFYINIDNEKDNIFYKNIDNEKDNMIYTIEESYKNLPNSNLFLNFISKTPLVDIIINAVIYYLFIYYIFFLYFYINNNGMHIIEKSILKNYITSENLDSIKKSLEYGVKIAYDLFNNYGGNVIVTWYRKLYNNGFIDISSIFDKFIFILPKVIIILTQLTYTLIYFKMFNKVINDINEILFNDKFFRFKIKNLLSANFPSIIYFMWNEKIDSSIDNKNLSSE